MVEAPSLADRDVRRHEIPARLTMTTVGGQVLTGEVAAPWDTRRPFDAGDRVTKYRALTVPVSGTAAREQRKGGALRRDEIRLLRDILPGHRG